MFLLFQEAIFRFQPLVFGGVHRMFFVIHQTSWLGTPSCRLLVFFNNSFNGLLNVPYWRNETMQIYGNFLENLPFNNALFGLVFIFHDPCH